MPRGVYDRAAGQPRANGRVVDPDSLVGKLNACKALAAKRKKADGAAMAAGEARDELAQKMREMSAGA